MLRMHVAARSLVWVYFLAFALAFGLPGHLSVPAVADDSAPAAPPAVPPAAPPAAAPSFDQIVLKTGRIFEGTILSEDGRSVVLSLPSETGGSGQMRFPREMIQEIRRGTERPPPLSDGTIRDTWYLLRSAGRTVGVRRLSLRRVKVEDAPGWRLEESVTWFARGRHVPATRLERVEVVDLAFLPVSLNYREVGEASAEPGGPGRYERLVVSKVVEGAWTARVSQGGQTEDAALLLPPRTRGRLGAREDLMRRRAAGVEPVAFLEPSRQQILTARAGYTVLDQPDGQGGRYDEFAWEEDGVRLVARYGLEGPVSEEVAEGVVASPVTEAQARAAMSEAAAEPAAPGAATAAGAPGTAAKATEVTLAEAGIAFVVPSPAWKVERNVVSPTDAGPRVVARLSNPIHVSDIRFEWDAEGVLAAPGPEEAETRLLQRLRVVCPDLAVTEARSALPKIPKAWRLGLRGTLRGQAVRTIAVVIDRAQARIVVLLACPEESWAEGRAALEQVVSSLRTL